ncbi:hypothetical protein D3C72_2542060 [compost metagenome]
MHRARQIRQEAARHGEGVRFRIGFIIHHAIAGMDVAAAQFILFQVLADARHDRRPGDE